jgi:toxin secretion/phage lysis holin
VVVAHLIDRLLGTNYLRDAAAIAFCLNEVISIIENAGLMGIPMPKVIIKALEVLRQKAGETEEKDVKAVSDGWPVDEEEQK